MKRLTLFGSALLCALSALAQTQDPRGDPSRTWIPRPWEYRYVLIVNKPSAFPQLTEILQEDMQSGELSITWPYPIFPDVHTIQIRPVEGFNEGAIGMLLIEFNRQGEVLTPHTGPAGLKGHINSNLTVVLAAGNAATDRQFRVARWYTGRSSEELIYTPALCSLTDLQDRYVKGFKPDSMEGAFGCREWGYYLKSERHPYIDVTAYEKKMRIVETHDSATGKSLFFKTNAYIRPFLGWGRFDVAPKPVIGNYENTWVCLHECPDGAAPGVIPDIKAWTEKRGWPLPKRPKKQPMFPDIEREPGEFVD
jgi:hypothetical protein